MAEASAEAFMGNDDPIGRFLFDGEPNHIFLKKRFFRSLVTSCSPKALRQASSEKMEAVAIWFQPGLGHGEDVDADPFRPEDFSNPETLSRLAAVGGVIEELTESLGNEPQWYLHLAAVRPGFMNQGYSSRLVRPVLEKARAEGLPCTLITQSMENARKYAHWGFRVEREMPVPGSSERFYLMRTDA
ncbi:MAG: hypothetical protein GX410_10135 [Elusimicrobia bacterium]|nr:hypothetical protein [Elusimicrobiota bacterium]